MKFKVGQRIKFKLGTRKLIGDYMLELSGLEGTVVIADRKVGISIQLDEEQPVLKKWGNILLYVEQGQAKTDLDHPSMLPSLIEPPLTRYEFELTDAEADQLYDMLQRIRLGTIYMRDAVDHGDVVYTNIDEALDKVLEKLSKT